MTSRARAYLSREAAPAPHDAATPDVRAIVASSLARGQAEQVRAYAQRGRRFAALDLDALTAAWLAGWHEWVRTIHPRSVALCDAEAEFMLRGLEPDYGTVLAELDAVTAIIGAGLDALSPEARDAIGHAILDEHEAERRRLN